MRALLVLLMLVGATAPAVAASAFYYSKAGQYFGWAAGYASVSSAEDRARRGCEDAGGTACELVATCENRGWGSIAFASGSNDGVGMVCSTSDRSAAVSLTLAVCMLAANELCWTESTFDPDANEVSRGSLEGFDVAWYVQNLLFALNFYDGEADGVIGPKTRAAIKRFEDRYGVPQDIPVDRHFVDLLVYAAGGLPAILPLVKEALIDPYADELSQRSFGYGTAPPPPNLSIDLAYHDERDRTEGLALVLMKADKPCSFPARSAVPVPPDGTGGWQVQCAEADYTLMFGGGVLSIMSGIQPITIDGGGIIIGGSGSTTTPESGTEQPSSGKVQKGGTGRTLRH